MSESNNVRAPKNDISKKKKKMKSQEKPHFFKKGIPKDPETCETIKQNMYLKKYWTKK